ncbi:MAG: mucin9, partial [Verrucomicrobiota bacterium]
DVATVNNLSDMFLTQPTIGVLQSGVILTNGASAASFGTVNVGVSVTNTFTVTNSGSATLIVSNMVVTGANAGDFTVSGITLPASVIVDGSVTFKIIFSPTGGCTRTATLQITNNDTNRNPFTLALAGVGAAAPVITSQPVSVTNYAGTSANFSVSATACTPPSYQWYLGTNSLAGETNSTLSIASVGPANVGDYLATVTTGGLSTNSNPATLTVIYQAPQIVGEQILPDMSGFELTFSGPTNQTYQVLASDDLTVPQSAWTVVGDGIFGNTNAIFTDTSATNQAGRFYTIKSP